MLMAAVWMTPPMRLGDDSEQRLSLDGVGERRCSVSEAQSHSTFSSGGCQCSLSRSGIRRHSSSFAS